jgi:thiamine-phosphate pyrophosphorylase
MKFDSKSLLVYAVTDRRWLKGKSLQEAVEEALDGGATFVQLREKDLAEDRKEAEALEIQALCKERNIPFVLDDDVRLAAKIHADGVHVGQSDMDALSVRKLLGADAIVGVSAGNVQEALAAEKAGADYLGVGAVFATGSKEDAEAVSFDTLKAITQAVSIPVIAIGGITRDNVSSLAGSGIAGVAVISAIFAQPDVKKAASDLRKAVLDMLSK